MMAQDKPFVAATLPAIGALPCWKKELISRSAVPLNLLSAQNAVCCSLIELRRRPKNRQSIRSKIPKPDQGPPRRHGLTIGSPTYCEISAIAAQIHAYAGRYSGSVPRKVLDVCGTQRSPVGSFQKPRGADGKGPAIEAAATPHTDCQRHPGRPVRGSPLYCCAVACALTFQFYAELSVQRNGNERAPVIPCCI